MRQKPQNQGRTKIQSYEKKMECSPEAPPINSRLTAVLAAKDLVAQAVVALVVVDVGVAGAQVLDLEPQADAARARAHGLGLRGGKVAREDAAVAVAGEFDEAARLFGVGPRVPAAVAAGLGALR